MTPIQWGIIGCGDVTEVKSGPALAKAHGSALAMVMRRTASLAADYARRHGVPRWTVDAAELIHHPSVDAVYIATPPDSHRHYVELAAAAGKPILVEKPMATRANDAAAMVDVCRQGGVPLFVAYYRRALPRFLAVKTLLDSGRLGAIRLVTVRHTQPPPPLGFDTHGPPWRLRPEVGGGGLFCDMGSHTLDLLDFLLGPIQSATGLARNQGGLYPAEDTVTAHLEFANGLEALCAWCYVVHRPLDRITLMGDRGELSFACFDTSPLEVTDGQGHHAIEAPNPPHVHQPLIQTVVDQLRGRGRCPSDGASALRTEVVMETLLGAWRQRAAATDPARR
ncbi:MAG: Gfo/Idh/MocA family protein [Candidatus Competibacterales bacterium]